MALSAQDLVSFALVGRGGTLINLGAGNLSGEPAIDLFWWLSDLDWKCLLALDIREDLIREAKQFHPTANCVHADALRVDYDELYKQLNIPKVIDVLSVDVDPCSIEVLKKLPFGEQKYKVIFAEHDLYVAHRGPKDKKDLMEFMATMPEYYCFADDVPLVHCTPNYLESWFVHRDFVHTLKVPDILNRHYYRINPNTIALDLMGIKV